MNFTPVKIFELDIAYRPDKVFTFKGYEKALVLIKYRGSVLGFINTPLIDGSISSDSLIRQAVSKFHKDIISRSLLQNFGKLNKGTKINDFLMERPDELSSSISITIAVCTRNRPDNLKNCLEAVKKSNYNNLEVLVIDNAPDDNAAYDVVKNFDGVKYAAEPLPGLNWARNRAVAEASGEIIAFTDDDVIADENWVSSIACAFENNSNVQAVTGLVIPYELETESQFLFERYGGFARGFVQKWYSRDPYKKVSRQLIGTGNFGTGANMAFRKSIFEKIGYFDPALDVGTVTNGGGDLDMFFRIVAEGYTLLYEPNAAVRHIHRKDRKSLREQIANNGVGFYSYLTRVIKHFPGERWRLVSFGLWWFYYWSLRRLIISILFPGNFPRELILAELFGSVKGLFMYHKASKIAARLNKELYSRYTKKNSSLRIKAQNEAYFEILNLNSELPPLTDTGAYKNSLFVIKRSGQLLGRINIANNYSELSRERLITEIADKINFKLFNDRYNYKTSKNEIKDLLQRMLAPAGTGKIFPAVTSVSIVIATFDRPDHLAECINSINKINTKLKLEIIVVDNNPLSGKTLKAIKNFNNVFYLSEKRKGLSYARNTGFAACGSDVAVCIDDDVIADDNWLEQIIEPFADDRVMAVTGNVLPYELKTKAQVFFELYGGLGRGFKKKIYDNDWFLNKKLIARPTWKIGATANAAFRTYIFTHPGIGLMEESLGAGSPAGCSEDTFFFYKILSCGFNIVYQPDAIVRHKHRETMKSFRKQIFNYSKGHVAYNLTTYTAYGDYRGLFRIFIELPLAHLQRIIKRLTGKSEYPVKYIFIEIAGNMLGPLAFILSRLRVKRLGRSEKYNQSINQFTFANPERNNGTYINEVKGV